jgi:hypothetical protein
MDALDATLWAFPAAFALHVADEAPGFTPWARRHASPEYTKTDFVRINGAGFALALARAPRWRCAGAGAAFACTTRR